MRSHPRADPATAEDHALAAAVADGDHTAFAELVDRHGRRVVAVCRAQLGDTDDADDAAQETFARLWRRAETFDGRASLATWLHRVAVNCCRDAQRRARRRPQRADQDVGELADRLADPVGLDGLLAGRGLDGALRAAVAALPSAQREAVVLVDVVGWPRADVAARQDVAVGTVKSRLHRAHARLADQLSGEPEPPDPASNE